MARQDFAKPCAVVLTTDCGADMDDQWTLAHLVLSSEIELRGVVTTHAPNLAAPAAETAARVVAEVLDHLGLQEVPYGSRAHRLSLKNYNDTWDAAAIAHAFS